MENRNFSLGHWEAHSFSRLFEVRVFKTAGKASSSIEHLESPAYGRLRQEAFCEFGDNLNFMSKPCFQNKQAATVKMAQWAKHLLCNHEHLGLIPRSKLKSQAW